ncbi:MAG: hypothetical protein AB1410_02545 [Acidobacteriota bacterium]
MKNILKKIEIVLFILFFSALLVDLYLIWEKFRITRKIYMIKELLKGL